jgi:hypothetical protein
MRTVEMIMCDRLKHQVVDLFGNDRPTPMRRLTIWRGGLVSFAKAEYRRRAIKAGLTSPGELTVGEAIGIDI